MRPGTPRRPVAAEVRSAEISGLPAYAFDRRWAWGAHLFVAVLALARFVQLRAIPLAPAGPPAATWTRRLDEGLSFRDPLLSIIGRAGPHAFAANKFELQLCTLAAAAGTLLCAYVLARRLFSPLTGFLTVALLGLSPLMALGQLLPAAYPLLTLFWSLTIVWLERALFAERRLERNRAWTFAAIAAGLGLLSSHAMLLLPLCLLLFLAISPSHRAWLRRPQPYLAFLLVPLLYAGLAWWTAAHSAPVPLPSFAPGQPGTPLRRLAGLIATQALLLGPVLCCGALVASAKGLTLEDRTAGAQRCRFLACMGLPVLALACLLSLYTPTPALGPACAWLPLTVLWAGWLTTWAGRSRRDAIGAYLLAGVAALLGGIHTLLVLLSRGSAGAG